MNHKRGIGLIRMLAEHVASHPRIEACIAMGRIQPADIQSVLEGYLSNQFAGAGVYVRTTKRSSQDRAARDRRILEAVERKLTIAEIAKQEDMSQYGVRRAVRRIKAQLLPP